MRGQLDRHDGGSGRRLAVVQAATADGGVGELGLAIEQEASLGDDVVALGHALQDFDVAIAHAAEAYGSGRVALVLAGDEDPRAAAVLENGGSGKQEDLRRVDSHDRLRRLPVEETPGGIVEHDANPGRPCHRVHVRIDERDRSGQHFARS